MSLVVVIVFALAGYWVMRYSRPLQLAIAPVVTAGLIAAFVGHVGFSLLVSSAITYGYTAFVYLLVDKYSDAFVAPVAILVVGSFVLLAAFFLN